MAINQNHLSEELNGVKCAIVEKNVTPERASFLKQLLLFNKYTVTDMMFNPINAIFGRQLHAPDGHVVTLAYWYQRDKLSHDEIPYYDEKKR